MTAEVPSRDTRELRLAVPFGPRGWGLSASIGAIALLIGVIGAAQDSTPWAVTGFVTFAVAATMIASGVTKRSRPIVVADGTLDLPRWPFGTRHVPLAEITGIGLLRVQAQLSRARRLHYWTERGDRPLDGILTDPRSIDQTSIGQTDLGAATLRLCRAVLAYQGEQGPLATQQAQRHPPARIGTIRVLASSSPDQ